MVGDTRPTMSSSSALPVATSDRDRFERRLGNAEDALVTCNVLEALVEHIRTTSRVPLGSIHHTIDVDGDSADQFTLSLTKGITVITNDHVRAMERASSRVLGVYVHPADGAIDIVIARSSAKTPPQRETHVSFPRERRVHIDYDAASVPKDDRTVLDAIIDAVYTSVKRVPVSMSCWYEIIRDGSSAAGASVGDDDASESLAGTTGAIIGYSLCFTHVPVVTGAFLEHLVRSHSSTVAVAYVHFSPSLRVSSSPIVVVNVRAASTPVVETKRAICTYIPRGVGSLMEPAQPPKKRARR